jgi:DNA-directed RNA polymerase specialized sigma24 family protein
MPALRDFERLSPGETMRVHGLREDAAGRRYARALRRLKGIVSGLGGDWLEP